MKNLDVKTIPLHGRHIIEASAGTGKTYNITELYIRLLLEKRLLPKQILVMTFTKDATQEIIGRVEAKLRSVLSEYTSERKESEKSDYQHLKRSLLEIDEAAIFTIHGFCKKILSEQAFASGIEMNVSMEVDTSEVLQKVTERYFRKNINNHKQKYQLLRLNNWHTPAKFLARDNFLGVIKSNHEIVVKEQKSFDELFIAKKNQLDLLLNNGDIVDAFLSKVAKGEAEGQRKKEYDSILDWLKLDDETIFPAVSIITNGNKIKAKDIKPIFVGIKELKELYLSIKQSQINELAAKICQQIRQDFDQEKKYLGVLDFDDLISNLCESVKSSTGLVKNLQLQYPVALIDEFQDTDAQQYEILDTVYPVKNSSDSCLDLELFKYESETLNQTQDGSEHLLLMIGDPKQAIYGFRGGDIFTYLKAKNSCDLSNQWSMDTNWRSTKQMIKAYNRLFYKSDFDNAGDVAQDVFSRGIDYQTVKASPNAELKNDNYIDDLKAMNYFYYKASKDDSTEFIHERLSNWTANEVVKLLNLKVAKEADIAILVENRNQALIVQQSLKQKDLSSVYLSQRENVYHSLQAQEILFLMEGINELENKLLLKRALSTSLLGGNVNKFESYLDDENIDNWDQELDKAKNLRNIWQKHGFMTFIMEVIHTSFELRDANKERFITNVLHLAELIKVAENKYKHPNQLIKWYRQQLSTDATSSEGELRLESDDNLIKIVTIHGSKGLEYPFVFIPFAAAVSTKKFSVKSINKYYDSAKETTIYNIGKNAIVSAEVNQEIIDESKRLLYVAITRAEKRCYIGVSDYKKTENSSLAQFLDYKVKDNWKEKIEVITNLPENESQFIDISIYENIELNSKQSNTSKVLSPQSISLENDDWQMLSFSKIAQHKKQNLGLEKEIDESDDTDILNIEKSEFRFSAPKGADLGNILHNVLEHTDFSTGVIDKDLLTQQMQKYKVVEDADFSNLNLWLEDLLVADIEEIGLQSKFCLKDIADSKALKEAEFYFPVSNNLLNKNKLLQFLSEYRGKPIESSDFSNEKVFGMLHGFIDLIFEHNGKFYIADYKSNYLGDNFDDYTQDNMREKNQQSFYDLQYLIYSVALVKYLKQNIKNFDFEKHFGGVYYFYLRGFKHGFGVYKARPTYKIIDKLSMLLTGDSNV